MGYCVCVAQNNIPVFCPGITDGSLGDMLYFHSYRSPGLILDLVEGIVACSATGLLCTDGRLLACFVWSGADIRGINSKAVFAKKSGMIILGGGITKHHICNANLMVLFLSLRMQTHRSSACAMS